MKIKILQNSKSAVPINTGNINNLNNGLIVKNKSSFVLIYNEETPATVASDPAPGPPPLVIPEITGFEFRDVTPWEIADAQHVGAKLNAVGVWQYLVGGERFDDYSYLAPGDYVPFGMFAPKITTQTGATLDAVYTVYTPTTEVYMMGEPGGITRTTINKGTEKTDIYGNYCRWNVQGTHPDLNGITFIDGNGVINTQVYSNVIPDFVFEENSGLTFVMVDLRGLKRKFDEDYPTSTPNYSEYIGSVYWPRLISFIPNANTTILKGIYGGVGGASSLAGYFDVIFPDSGIVNNYLIQIKDKFFTWVNPKNYQSEDVDIPECLAGSSWDPNNTSNGRMPKRTQHLWQKDCLLEDYCFGPMPDGTTLDVYTLGSMYWDNGNFYIDVSAQGYDPSDSQIGPESISGIDGFGYIKYDFIYYDWAIFWIDETTKEMTKIVQVFQTQNESNWENLQNVIFGLPTSVLSQYIQPGMRLVLLCRAYVYKRSLRIYVNELGDAQDFISAYNGGMSPVTGCWEGSFDYPPPPGSDPPSWSFQPAASIKTNWAWTYITIPEIGTATPENPISIYSTNVP